MRLLFFPINATSFSEMHKLASSLSKTYTDVNCDFLYSGASEGVEKLAEDFLLVKWQRGVWCWLWLIVKSFNFLLKRFLYLNLENDRLLITLSRFPTFSVEIILAKKMIKNFLSRKGYDGIFFSGDRHLKNYEYLFVDLCQELDIKSIVPAYVYFPSESLVKVRRSKRFEVTNSICGQYIDQRCPQQIFRASSKEFLFFDKVQTLVLMHLNHLPINPWVMGLSSRIIICADSEVRQQLYIGKGIARHRVPIVGQISFDDIFYHRARILTRRKSDTVVVWAIPQLWEHNLLDFETHIEKINEVAEVLSDYSLKVVCSLHPKMKFKHYKFLEKEYGFEISSKQLSQTIAEGDLFVSTFSSTIIWALILGMPVLNYDYVKLRGSLPFLELEGHYVMDTIEEFESELKELTCPVRLENIKLKLQDVSRCLGSVDGTSCKKYYELLKGGL